MYQYLRSLTFFFVTVLFASAAGAEASGDGAGIPFPAALEAAAIRQERLDPIFDHSLILGNGDINGLLFEREGNLFLRVTKNDVWDTSPARPFWPKIPGIRSGRGATCGSFSTPRAVAMSKSL